MLVGQLDRLDTVGIGADVEAVLLEDQAQVRRTMGMSSTGEDMGCIRGCQGRALGRRPRFGGYRVHAQKKDPGRLPEAERPKSMAAPERLDYQ